VSWWWPLVVFPCSALTGALAGYLAGGRRDSCALDELRGRAEQLVRLLEHPRP